MVKVHDSFEMVSVESLEPYARNARTHSAEQIEAIVKSIRTYGFTNPLLVRRETGTIIAGHGRLEAASQLGIERVPVVWVDGLTEAQFRALVIADNAIAERAGWNDDMLKVELGAIQALDFDVTLTGMDLEKLGSLLDIGGDDETADIAGDPDESASGVEKAVVVLPDGRKVPVTDEEAVRLHQMADDYAEENGTMLGFFGAILDGDL